MNTTDIDAPYQDVGSTLSSPTSKSTARRLRHTRQRLGSYRHDLLVAMRIVNSIEKEMMQSEWENWLMDENLRCEQVQLMLQDGKDKSKRAKAAASQKTMADIDTTKIEVLKTWHDEYCGSCRADRDLLELLASRNSMIA